MALAVTIEVTHWPLPRPTTRRGGKYLRTTHKVLTCTDRPGMLGAKTASGCTGLGHDRDKINWPLKGKGPGKGVGRTGDQMNKILLS